MFESNYEKDLNKANSKKEREDIKSRILQKYRAEFLEFVEEVKTHNVVLYLYYSTIIEETIFIWKEYTNENHDFINKIISWAMKRDDYFGIYSPIPLFENSEKIENTLEIGLLVFILRNECVFSHEDINENFIYQHIYILKNSPNRIVRAVARLIESEDYEINGNENIFKYYFEV